MAESESEERELEQPSEPVQNLAKEESKESLITRDINVIYDRQAYCGQCARNDSPVSFNKKSFPVRQPSKEVHGHDDDICDEVQDRTVPKCTITDTTIGKNLFASPSVEHSGGAVLAGYYPKLISTSNTELEQNIDTYRLRYPFDPQQLVQVHELFPLHGKPARTDAVSTGMYREFPYYTRPQWPCESWTECVIDKYSAESKVKALFDVYKVEKNVKQAGTDEYVSSPADCELSTQSPLLQIFLETVIREISLAQHPAEDTIRSDVEKMMRETVGELQSKYSMFQDCQLHGMGSTYEGTKIGSPDEFDFLLELRPLVHMNIIKFKKVHVIRGMAVHFGGFTFQESELRDYEILDRTFFSDILEDIQDIDDEKSEVKDDEFIKELWYHIECKIAKLLMKNLLPGWTWLDQVPGFSTLAMTQILQWEHAGSKLFVHIDLCIAVPLPDFDLQVDWMQELKGVPIFSRKDVITGNIDRPEMIFRSDGKARLSRCHYELTIWQSIPNIDGRKTVYRAAKQIVSKYIRKKYNDELFRMESLIPSYWIKTILFYMFLYYRRDEYWSSDVAAQRLVELFQHLESCLESKQLSSFFVPHNVLKSIAPLGDGSKHAAILKEVKKVTSCLCCLSYGESKAIKKFSEMEEQSRILNADLEETGLFKSLIEILYVYAYNDFPDENFTKIHQFKDLFLKDSVEITGQGRTLKLSLHGKQVNINEKLQEYWNEKDKYFCDG